MKKRTEITAKMKEDMTEMFESGFKVREIAELVGCSQDTVYNYKKAWRIAKANNICAEIPSEHEPETEVPEALEHSDYAKAYLSNDPAVVHSSLEIKRSVSIRSNKTGILYEMELGGADQKMTITLADGQEIDIELKMFERFVDEGIDVYLEMKRGA